LASTKKKKKKKRRKEEKERWGRGSKDASLSPKKQKTKT
jgi:hypothetical protein